MTVTLHLPSALASYAAGRREIQIEVKAGTTARAGIVAAGEAEGDASVAADAAVDGGASVEEETAIAGGVAVAGEAAIAAGVDGDAGAVVETHIARSAAITVAQVLDQLAGDLPALERRIRDERAVIRRHVNVYVDGADIRALSGADTLVPDGATIDIIAAVSGG